MSQQLVTGYAAAKIVNAILVENGHREVPAQLVYQYMQQNFITSYTTGATTPRGDLKKFVDLNGEGAKDFPQWLVKYLGRKGITVTLAQDERPDSSTLQSAARG
jgi:hypothetical protein